jgi:hypothetical protein
MISVAFSFDYETLTKEAKEDRDYPLEAGSRFGVGSPQ